MAKYLCLHGHFYQPPREDPWTGQVPEQPSAAPFHDWNERVWREAYEPNAKARRVDSQGRILDVVNNYQGMSFNFGPTLLAWLESGHPDSYRSLIEDDRLSRRRFGEYGAAMAQAYGHMIMPLAGERDKITQVKWGVADFLYRFGRRPEGMWLPETAADKASLDVLADHGIRFTILSSFQASRIRPLDGGQWRDVSGGGIDTTRAYRMKLFEGRHIDLLFYHADLSRGVAFEGLLKSGEKFVESIQAAYHGGNDEPQLVLIAADGETYGHHHKFGEMALAYVIDHFSKDKRVELTIPAKFLDLHPPRHEVEIIEPSAWSCPHGVGRWERDCGCHSGAEPGWNQRWRRPLRDSLDRLRDQLAEVFEHYGQKYFLDPWAARDDYVDLLPVSTYRDRRALFLKHGRPNMETAEEEHALELLEMQHRSMQMFTSCGWFFDDIAGIEATQVLAYAFRAIEIARSFGVRGLTRELIKGLSRAEANKPGVGTGADVLRAVISARTRLALKWILETPLHLGLNDQLAFHVRRARGLKLDLDHPEISQAFLIRIQRRLAEPEDALSIEGLDEIKQMLDVAKRLSITLDLWTIQNTFDRLLWRINDLELAVPKASKKRLGLLAVRLGFHPDVVKKQVE